jgi:hypothetical protein
MDATIEEMLEGVFYAVCVWDIEEDPGTLEIFILYVCVSKCTCLGENKNLGHGSRGD